MVDFKMTLGDVSVIQKCLRDVEGDLLDWLARCDGLPISPQGHAVPDRLTAALDGFDVDTSSWNILCVLLIEANAHRCADHIRASAIRRSLFWRR